MTVIASSAVTGARSATAPRTVYTHVPTPPPPRSVPTAFTGAQHDMLEFAYEEDTARRTAPAPAKGRRGKNTPVPVDTDDIVVATIPPAPHLGAVSRMYADARVLELGGLVTLTAHGPKVGDASPHRAPWHYVWAMRLTPEGRRAAQEYIAVQLCASLPAYTPREMARRAVPDPSVGADMAAPAPAPDPASASVPAPRKAPRPVAEHNPGAIISGPPVEVVRKASEKAPARAPRPSSASGLPGVCAHCGDPFPTDVRPSNAHTWTSPLPEEGQTMADVPRFHIDRPSCRDACNTLAMAQSARTRPAPPVDPQTPPETEFVFS